MKTSLLTVVAIIINLILISCTNTLHSNKELLLTNEDSTYVESSLQQYKNCLFSDLYNRSIKATYKRKGIKQKDTLPDLTYYFNNGFNPDWMLEDQNREALFIKWLNDETYTPIAMPPDHPDGSLDVSRALDFYNSEDLEKYLDSLRQSEYNRLRKIRN